MTLTTLYEYEHKIRGFNMGKEDGSKPASVPNRHLYARISYLYQASTYLSIIAADRQHPVSGQHSADVISSGGKSGQHSVCSSGANSTDQPQTNPAEGPKSEERLSSLQSCGNMALSRYLTSQLRDVSLKGQIRLSSNIKQSICWRCQSVLIPGRSSTATIENLSRLKRKSWADVLVIQCNACGSQKRFPVGVQRQPRKDRRSPKHKGQLPTQTTVTDTTPGI